MKTFTQLLMPSYFFTAIVFWLWPTPASSETGIITNVAGTTSGSGYSGDGKIATNAKMRQIQDIAVDDVGNLYISDSNNNRIRKVNVSSGIIRTFAGTGTRDYNGDDIDALTANIAYPRGIALDRSGENLYIADAGNYRIRKVNFATGKITTVAGNGTRGYSGDGGAATNAQFYPPNDIALDSNGNLYLTDQTTHRIRKIDAITQKISVVAGNGTQGYNGDNIAAINSQLNTPSNIALDKNNNLYIADTGNHRIRKVDTFTGTIRTIAGAGLQGDSNDGVLATNAQLNHPRGIVLDSKGNLYITERYRIRKVDVATGIISTIAGDGTQGAVSDNNGDGSLAISAQFYDTGYITLDGNGDLYLTDAARVRKVSLPPTEDQPDLTIKPSFLPLDGTKYQNLTFTITNTASSVSSATLAAPTISGYYSHQFTVNRATSNDCTNLTLNIRESCNISISYEPDINQAQPNTMAVLNIPDSQDVVHAQALISSNEATDSEAARRLPDVLTSINIPTLTVGSAATITWTMTGYQTDAYSQIALFECNTDGSGNAVSTCGNSYANRTVASEVLSPTTIADGDWTFREAQAQDRTSSYIYTPGKAGPVVLRFYQKSGLDKDAGNNGTSLLIPGGLSGAGGSFGYFDAEGRRIKATVQ